jgi:hypothetical protein
MAPFYPEMIITIFWSISLRLTPKNMIVIEEINIVKNQPFYAKMKP